MRYQKAQARARKRRGQRLHLQESRHWWRRVEFATQKFRERFGDWSAPHIITPYREPPLDPQSSEGKSDIQALIQALQAGSYQPIRSSEGKPLKIESLEATMRVVTFRFYPTVAQSKMRLGQLGALTFLLLAAGVEPRQP